MDIDPDDVIRTQEDIANEQALQQALAGMQQGGQGSIVNGPEGMVSADARNGTAPPDGEGPVGNNGGLPL